MNAIVLLPILSFFCDSFRGRAVLQLALLAVRHQLAAVERTSPRPSLRLADRLLWVILTRILPNYRAGRPGDMMDKARALPTFPQAQQQQQDVINRILAA